MTTENNSAPPLPPQRYIEAGAVVTGGPAWLVSRVLRSPNVARLLDQPPAWIERDDLTATVTAIHLAGRAFEVSLTAPKRGNETTASAVMPESGWTTKRAADYLGLSPRRLQERATEFGGRKVGRQWIFDEMALRHEHARRRQRAA
jgi:hypothetical protein